MQVRWFYAFVMFVGCVRGTPTPIPPPPTPAPKPPIVVVDPPPPTLRLPRTFAPSEYRARLAIDPASPTFAGQLEIVGDLATPSSVIWLHGKHLAIERARAEGANHTQVALTVTPRGDDLLEVRAATPLAAGPWTLALAYHGTFVTDDVVGAFVTTYDRNRYVITDFEPGNARRVFPCLDEPDRKVPWQLALDIPRALVAASNTPIATTTDLDATHRRITFAKTRPLPSYLVAFAVGPFAILDAGATRAGVPVRVIVPRGAEPKAAYLVSVLPRLVDLAADWFGVPFPYPKLDVVVSPALGGAAMEDAGMIVSDAIRVLVPASHPSWTARHELVGTMGHELAHQWFGDLVTPRWWDDLWLNEAFATWMENKITAGFEPSWHDEGSEASLRRDALAADALSTARAIHRPIETADDIENAFDTITYQKGAAILAMLESHLGADTVRTAVGAYLRAHADGNATAADLVAALEAAARRPIAALLAGFLDRAGAPELAATLDCTKPAPTLTITQRRFVPPGAPVPTERRTWQVPACIAYEHAGGRAETCAVVADEIQVVELAGACPRWWMLNAGARGYYHTAIAPQEVGALGERAWPHLTTTERRVAFEDVRVETLRGKLPVAAVMTLAAKLRDEPDRFAVADALGGVGRLGRLGTMTGLPVGFARLVPPALVDRLEARLGAAIGPRARAIGFAPPARDDLASEVIASALVQTAAALRDPVLAKQAVALAAHYRELPAATRSLVLPLAADTSPAIAAQLHADVLAAAPEQRRELLSALGGIRDPARLTAELALALDPRIPIDTIFELLLSARGPAAQMAVQTFVRAHLPELRQRMPPPRESSFGANLGWAFTRPCEAARRDEVAAYLHASFGDMLGGDALIAQQLEAMDQCIAARAVIEPSLRAWLAR